MMILRVPTKRTTFRGFAFRATLAPGDPRKPFGDCMLRGEFGDSLHQMVSQLGWDKGIFRELG